MGVLLLWGKIQLFLTVYDYILTRIKLIITEDISDLNTDEYLSTYFLAMHVVWIG